MNTEIKSTLFSMVTMRAPQPVDKAREKIRFVFRDDSVTKGVFDTAAANPDGSSKWEAMKRVITNGGFPYLKNESAVEALSPKLYGLGIWIARNRLSFSTAELSKELEKVTALKFTSKEYQSLWDNLFFQVLTEKDFYVKEAVIQMLTANHVLLNSSKADDIVLDELVNSKVVLPSELFVENTPTTTLANKKAGDSVTNSYPNQSMQQLQAIAMANLDMQAYTALSKELIRLEKKYKKEYDDAYSTKLSLYDAKYETAWASYYTALEAAKQNWCSVRDPKIPFDPNNPCDKPAFVAEPDVLPFEFSFRDELDLTFLQENLTPASFATVLRLLELEPDSDSENRSEAPTGTIEDFNSFEDLRNDLTARSITAQNTIHANTRVSTPSYMSFGGVLIPNYQKISNNPFGFTICAKIIGTRFINFDLAFDVPDGSWKVVNIACSFVHNLNNVVQNGAPYLSTASVLPIDGQIKITNIYDTGIDIKTFLACLSFDATITFDNGCQKSFKLTNYNTISCIEGTMTGDCDKDDTTSGGNNSYESSFLPSGFGMKQIGIADYKIVEQSVHCYIEGEVAHIENIMARERREKSTRKLTRSETTDTTKSESERETNTDTSSTSRFEMQSEIAQVIQQSKDFNADTHFHVNGTRWSLDANVGMATHSSKDQNTRQAITNAKEVTEKAAERITNKVSRERVEKIIEEFEETNIHEFDNRKGDKHVVGVYRWVDKIYKNQIVNFGKRLMFEFMVPEPSQLHRLGMEINSETTTSPGQITAPVDPRQYDLAKAPTDPTNLNLGNFSLIKDSTLRYWAGYYNVELTAKPDEEIYVGKSMYIEKTPDRESVSKCDTIKIDENYKAVAGKATVSGHYDGDGGDQHVISVLYGNVPFTITSQNFSPASATPANYVKNTYLRGTMESGDYKAISGFKNEVPISLQYYNYHTGTVNFSIRCQLTDEARQKWQQESFKAIIDKYEEAKEAFDKLMAENKETTVKTKETNPAFFHQMMNLILRKNCISYMINQDQSPTVKNTYGRDMTNGANNFEGYEIAVNQDLDRYAALVKFIEQAFEWSIMSYNFYPYYWARRNQWKRFYQFTATDDPLFNSFMQAGMARVIVTVRPGFEEAVRYYMQTGRIWNGGEVPIINDKLFLAIVDELREPAGKKEGKAWATRLPTTMTILQANSIGLQVEKALPCNCDETGDFENPGMIPCKSNFLLTDAQLGNSDAVNNTKLFGTIDGIDGAIAKIELKDIDGTTIMRTLCNDNGYWELTQIPADQYELFIDSTNQFPETLYNIVSGTKQQLITLDETQSLEFNLVLAKL